MKILPRRFLPVGTVPAILLLAGQFSAHAGTTADRPPLPPITPVNQVSVAAVVPVAYAASGSAGGFEITRSNGDVLSAVKVKYQLGGRAMPGREYVALKGAQIIPAGETMVRVKVHPLVVAGSSGTYKAVRLTLLPGTDYSLTTAVVAKVRIVQ